MARRKRFFAGSVAAITISFFRKRNPCNASNVVADVEKLGFVLGAVGGRSRRREKLSGLLSGLPLGPSDPPLLSAHAPFRNTSTRPLATRREPQSPPPVPMQGILPSRVISGFLSRWGAAPGVWVRPCLGVKEEAEPQLPRDRRGHQGRHAPRVRYIYLFVASCRTWQVIRGQTARDRLIFCLILSVGSAAW